MSPAPCEAKESPPAAPERASSANRSGSRRRRRGAPRRRAPPVRSVFALEAPAAGPAVVEAGGLAVRADGPHDLKAPVGGGGRGMLARVLVSVTRRDEHRLRAEVAAAERGVESDGVRPAEAIRRAHPCSSVPSGSPADARRVRRTTAATIGSLKAFLPRGVAPSS